MVESSVAIFIVVHRRSPILLTFSILPVFYENPAQPGRGKDVDCIGRVENPLRAAAAADGMRGGWQTDSETFHDRQCDMQLNTITGPHLCSSGIYEVTGE